MSSSNSWELARARWQQPRGGLLPLEKAVAVVAFGQMLRVGADFVGFWGFVRRRVPDAQAPPAAGEPVRFFEIKADGVPCARPEAHALLRRLGAAAKGARSSSS